jgi:predicted RNA-binding protein with PIN domain
MGRKIARKMKTFLIDGYNVIYKIPQLERKLDKSLEAARTALIEYVKMRRSGGAEYVIVFEGRDEYRGIGPVTQGGIKIIFTNTKEEADTRIITLLKDSLRPSDFIIVSDDNYVRNHAKAFGAGGIGAAEFFKVSKARDKGTCDNAVSDYCKDSHKINEELKKVWGI